MPVPARVSFACLIGFLLCGSTACTLIPRQTYMAQQYQSYRQNCALASERDGLRSSLEVANRRVENLRAERSELQQRYLAAISNAKHQKSPLSEGTARRLAELQRRYPQFEFDPTTGVSKFHSDILFNSGSADVKGEAEPLLRDFAAIMNDGDTQRLNILVVGHTDDRPIVKQGTKSRHPTNWNLSTDRADSVVLELHKAGIKQDRMGAAGYSMFQPVVANKDDASRRQNRRVEIFVLAPDATIAGGWDPGISRD